MKPCPYVTNCAVVTFDKRIDNHGAETTVSIGLDLKDGCPEYFVKWCVKDIAGCQHFITGGAVGCMLNELFNRGCRLIFDRVILPSRGKGQDAR